MTFGGLDKIATYFSNLVASFPDLDLETLEEIHNQVQSWLLLGVNGTLTGSFLGLNGCGNLLNFEAVLIITWGGDDRVVELKSLNDSLSIFQQLGQTIVKEDNKTKLNTYLSSLRRMGLIPEIMGE